MKRKHHELRVWQEAMALAREVYRVTGDFPKEELFGLTGQMRRAAVSVPSNLAEGAGRNGNREFLKFLAIARGSLCELDTQFRLACDIGYCQTDNGLPARIEQTFNSLGALINSVEKRISQ